MSLSRREFNRMGLITATGLLAPGTGIGQNTLPPAAQQPPSPVPTKPAAVPTLDPALVPAKLAPYVDPLPIPPVIRPGKAGSAPVTITMAASRQKVHRDLRPTTLWTYNGSWPGPTIEVERDQPFLVNWVNHLPMKHFLPLDFSIHGEEETVPPVRAVVHVHGAQTLPEDDGYPDAWITPDGKKGAFYRPGPNRFPNSQPAATLWYHDHSIGTTRLNIYAGLAGFYLIRDPQEAALNLPSGAYEIPLMLQDRYFLPNGTLLYPAAIQGTHPVWIQEFFGNAVCVNGMAKPYLEVEPRKYRFRMVNGSNARFYHLTLRPSDATGKPTGAIADAPAFQQIGSDAGLFPAPVARHFLLAAPGERFDFVLDFTGLNGSNFVLMNDAPAPYTRGGEVAAPEVMLFKVTKPLAGPDTSSLPTQLVPFEPLDPSLAVRERRLTINEMDRPSDGYTMMGMLDGKHWDDPVSEDPKAGSTEIWTFVNTTGDVHPIHLHLVRFQILNRQPFDVQNFQTTGKIRVTGNPIPTESNERPAWKDTVKTYPGYVTRVIMRFDLPPGTPIKPGQRFRYVWHCHILEHEDNEMMRPYDVVG